MRKNVASQIIGAQMVNIADGLAFTGTARVAITIDGGVQDTTPGGSAVAHEGRGYHSYDPTQAETNGDIVAFTFDDSGGLAVPVTVQVYTIDAIATDVWAEGTRTVTAATNITSDASAINVTSGVVDTVTTAITATNLTNLPTIPANWLTAAGTAADFGTEVGVAVWAETTRVLTAGTNLNDIAATDIVSGGAITTSAGAVTTVTTAANVTTLNGIAANVITTASIAAGAITDTELTATGTNLTAINLPNQTMDIVGDITGNLSGSVGSVTGAVGSVTGAVGSVTGSVGSVAGNVDGSTASVTGAVGSVTGAVGSVTAQVSADMTAISGSTVAANNLEESAEAIIPGAAEAGTLSATVMTSNLTGYLDDELIGRVVIWKSGTADGQASDITDYAASAGTVTYTAIPNAPVAGDLFVIV